MILVDTNVLIDVLEDDPQWAEWSVTQLRAHSKIHELGINAIVYAELSLAFERLEQLDAALRAAQEQYFANLWARSMQVANEIYGADAVALAIQKIEHTRTRKKGS